MKMERNLRHFVVLLQMPTTMLKPAFQIEVSNISDEEMLQSRLLVEVNGSSFTYVLLNQRNMSPLVVKYFQLELPKGVSLTETLQ